MSEIREMIRELCPDGVEFMVLGEICTIKTGKGITQKECEDDAPYPVMSGGQSPMGMYYDYNREGDTVTVSRVGAYAGFVSYLTERFYCNDKCFSVIPKGHVLLLPKYLYYNLKQKEDTIKALQSEGGVPTINTQKLGGIEIPVPPMAVQRKIVEILDNFSNLTAELEAELEERKRQYEYYRNLLLTFNPVANGAVTGGEHQINDATENRGGLSVKWLALSEIGEMIKGSGIQKSDFVEQGLPCIHYGQLHTYYGTFAFRTKSFISKALFDRSKKAQHGDLIIATTSEDVEACCKATAWLGEEEIAVSGDAHIFHHNQNPKYLAYFFQTENFAKQKRKYASGVKVVRVKGEQLLKVIIPLPSLEEQQRIVDILDRFETLTTDLQSGIPAEIAARRQQYEYYREQLLTFKRKAA